MGDFIFRLFLYFTLLMFFGSNYDTQLSLVYTEVSPFPNATQLLPVLIDFFIF